MRVRLDEVLNQSGFFTSEFLTRAQCCRNLCGDWWIGKSDTEMGKSATKAIVMLLSGKFFYQKSCRRGEGGGDLKCCGVENLLAPPGFCCPPPLPPPPLPKILATPLPRHT